MSIFSCCAVLLAAIGVYGVTAHVVQLRTREIGIRMALGADAHRVRLMVLTYGMRIALAGIAAGVTASWWLASLIAGLLFGVSPRDPAVFVAAPAALFVLALAGAWIPARRATRVDPQSALRAE